MNDEANKIVYRELIKGIPDTSKEPWTKLEEITETTASVFKKNLDPEKYEVEKNYSESDGGKVSVKWKATPGDAKENEKPEKNEILELRIGASSVCGAHTIIGPNKGKLKLEYDSASEFEEMPVMKIDKMEFKEKPIGIGIGTIIEAIANTYKLPLYEVKGKSNLYIRMPPHWYLVQFKSWDKK